MECCYAVLDGRGRFWGSWGWTRRLDQAKLWSGPEGAADAKLAASCLRRLGESAEVEYLPGLALQALAGVPALAA